MHRTSTQSINYSKNKIKDSEGCATLTKEGED